MGGAGEKTILLVEDEAIIAVQQKRSLERYGYRVHIAVSGEDAIQAVEASATIDLILMDINLGRGIDGTEAAQRILKSRDIPVVFVSSHVEPEIVKKTEQITSYGYVVKNSGITVLDASIKMAFRLHEANRIIRENEIKQKVMISSISDVIGILSARGDITYISPSIEKNFGWRPTEFSGCFWSMLHPDDVERVRGNISSLLGVDAAERTMEFRTRRRDGSYRQVELTACNLLADPVIAGILVNYHDITERKLESQELAMRKGLLLDIIESASEAIFAKDLSGRYQIINKAGARMLGYSPEQMVGRSDSELLPEEVARRFLESDERVISSGQKVDRETAVTINGRRLVYIVHESPWMDSSGRIIGVIGVANDITERKAGENHQKEQAALLNTIIESLAQPIFAKDAEGRYVSANEAGALLLGHAKPDLLGRTARDLLPLETAAAIEEADEAVMRRGGGMVMESSTSHDGKTTLYSVTKSPWKDEAGRIIGVVDVSYDITESRAAAQEFSRQKNLLRSILESSSEAIFAKDGSGKYQVINEVGAQILGLSASDMISRRDDEIFPPELALRFQRDDEYVMSNDKVVERETIFTRNGKELSYLAHKSAWKDESGRIIGVIGVSGNITERRKLELELSRANAKADRSQEKFNILADSLPVTISYFNAGTLEYEYVNRPFQESLAMPLGRILGCSLESVLGSANFAFARPYIEEARSGKSVSYENYFNLISGRRWIRVNYSPIFDKRQRVESILTVSYDISEHKKAEEDIRGLLEEKELLLKEVHHRIKNNMTTVRSLLSLQASKLRDPEAVKALEDAGSRIQSMMILYDRTYQSTSLGAISAQDYLSTLVDDIADNFGKRSLVRIEKKIEDFSLSVQLLQPLGIIINELLTNIMKYAFGEEGGGEISVSVALSDGLVTLQLGDNGRGMPEDIDFDRSTGFGLMLVGELTKQLHGSIRIERGRGTKIILQFMGSGALIAP